MKEFIIEVKFYNGDSIELEIEADNVQQAMDFAMPSELTVIKEGEE